MLPTNKAGYASWNPLSRRAASAADVERWFKSKPDINIGLICGQVSGLYVLDVDGKPPKDIGELPPTVTVKTKRGWHYYFKSNKSIKTYNLGKWGSLQGEGSYIVAAGSAHPKGGFYEYADSLSINDIEIAELPEWLADGRKRKKYVCSVESSRAPAPTYCGKQDQTPSTNLESLNHINKSVVRIDSNTCYTLQESIKELVLLNGSEEVARAVMGLCDRDIKRIGAAFRCPLPGHDEKKASAALWKKGENGFIMMRDFHAREYTNKPGGNYTDENGFIIWWPLPDVYAATVTGKPVLLRKGEKIVWWLRALHQTGYLTPPILNHYPLPAGVKKYEGKLNGKPYKVKAETVSRLYDGFIYLLELRQLYEPQKSAPFSWSFASGWCGIGSMSTIQKAMNWLLQHGYLYDARPMEEREGKTLTLFAIGRPYPKRKES